MGRCLDRINDRRDVHLVAQVGRYRIGRGSAGSPIDRELIGAGTRLPDGDIVRGAAKNDGIAGADSRFRPQRRRASTRVGGSLPGAGPSKTGRHVAARR